MAAASKQHITQSFSSQTWGWSAIRLRLPEIFAVIDSIHVGDRPSVHVRKDSSTCRGADPWSLLRHRWLI